MHHGATVKGQEEEGLLQAITVGQRVPRPGTDAMPMALSIEMDPDQE